MPLEVIGSGLGRTGTKSLQTSLNMLGFGPCHHMAEVWTHPESMQLWIEAAKGAPVWDEIFADYRSAVDYPSAAYWEELSERYPRAKVIHTARDPDEWFESTQATIFAPDGPVGRAIESDSPVGDFFRSFLGELLDHMNDRAFLTDYARRHTEKVKATIAPDRLLIYQVSEGWEPLCSFLGVAVPSEPFPAVNTRAEFVARVQASRDETGGRADLR
jgi:hypothetical protein